MHALADNWKMRPGATALRVGSALLALTVLIGLLSPGAFFAGYLSAVVLWIGVPLGAGAFLLLHHLVGGRWGWPLRPLLIDMVRTAPLIALLFLPVLVGLSWLYPWARSGALPEMVAAKVSYLNEPFFVVRTLGYLLLWCIGALAIARASRVGGTDRESAANFAPRLGAIGLILYVLTMSFAGIDWVGSLEPVWFSSIFGLYVVIGQPVAALSVVIILQRFYANPAEVEQDQPGALHDAGNLLLAAIVLHAYFALSQFLIIWNGNLPHEIGWFAPRIRGWWGLVALGLVLFHFFIPFAALLSRQVKRTEQALVRVAEVLLFACLVDTVWMVLPSYGGSALLALFLAVTATAGVGGIWYWLFDRFHGAPAGRPVAEELGP